MPMPAQSREEQKACRQHRKKKTSSGRVPIPPQIPPLPHRHSATHALPGVPHRSDATNLLGLSRMDTSAPFLSGGSCREQLPAGTLAGPLSRGRWGAMGGAHSRDRQVSAHALRSVE